MSGIDRNYRRTARGVKHKIKVFLYKVSVGVKSTSGRWRPHFVITFKTRRYVDGLFIGKCCVYIYSAI